MQEHHSPGFHSIYILSIKNRGTDWFPQPPSFFSLIKGGGRRGNLGSPSPWFPSLNIQRNCILTRAILTSRLFRSVSIQIL